MSHDEVDLEVLPPEIWRHIVCLLSEIDLARSLAPTCRFFARYAPLQHQAPRIMRTLTDASTHH